MSSGAGRKFCSEWNEIIDCGDKVKCKHCKETISKRVGRIRQHLQKCKKNVACIKPSVSVPSDLEQQFEPPSKKSNLESNLNTTVLSTELSQAKPNLASSMLQSSMFSYGVVTSASQKVDIDKSVARFFYANNIAFNVAENNEFNQMIQSLRPGYKPPNREQLSGTLLNDIHDEVEGKLKNELLSEVSLTLMIDGWSSQKNDAIIACSIHTGKKSYLLKAIDCGAEKKSAEYCANFITTAIEEIEKKYNKNIFAVCSDNENKMNLMREKIKILYPNLITYGCSSHMLNLFANEITPSNLIKHVIEVQKYFRNKHNAHGWLKDKGGLMPQIPNDTRWNSQEECLRTFVKNFHKYNEIRLEHMNEFSAQISSILTNAGIFAEASHLLEQLKVVSVAIDKLQSDSTTLSDAVEIWLSILQDQSLESYYTQFEKRFHQAFEPFHFLAHITDPKYFGDKLSAEQEEVAEQWLLERHPEFLPYILKFKIKDHDMFPANMFSKDVMAQFTAKKWWQLMKMKLEKREKSQISQEFCDFLMKLHSCPPSSAAIERIFSSYGLIWNKLRNRLGAEKLVKIYRFYRSSEPIDI